MKRFIFAAMLLLPCAARAQSLLMQFSAPISGTTSVTPGTWTQALSLAQLTRHGCTIQDSGTATINIAVGATIPTAPEFSIVAGQAFNCISQERVWVESSTASVSYQGASW